MKESKEELFLRYLPLLRKAAKKAYWMEFEDAFQSSFLAGWEEFDNFSPGTSFAKFLYKTAMRRLLKYKKKREVSLEKLLSEGWDFPVQHDLDYCFVRMKSRK